LVIADGGGGDRTLDLSSVRKVRNTIENPAVHGSNGWYAINHGKLALPALHVRPGSGTYTWGDEDADATIDLVNSVRLNFTSVEQGGDVALSLLATARADVPAGLAGRPLLSVWGLEDGGIAASDVELTIRYDDTTMAALRLPETALQLWQYAGEWQPVDDASFHIDTASNLLFGRIENATNFAIATNATSSPVATNAINFTVATPEPCAAALLLMGAGSMLLRRRRAVGRDSVFKSRIPSTSV
jgi:hypothetical protein